MAFNNKPPGLWGLSPVSVSLGQCLPFLLPPLRPADSTSLGEETGFAADSQTSGVFALTPTVWGREVTERLVRHSGRPGGQEMGRGCQ